MARPQGIFGAEITRSAGLKSGTLYPLLLRLEDAGWLISEWEVEEAPELGRPRRRIYRVTALGQREARHAAKQVHEVIGRLRWT